MSIVVVGSLYVGTVVCRYVAESNTIDSEIRWA